MIKDLKYWFSYVGCQVYGASDLQTLKGAYEDKGIIKIILEHPVYGLIEHDSIDFSLVLRPLSDLTKEITHNEKKIIPLIELFKLARGSYEMCIKNYSIMSSQWIKIEMLGYRDYHLRLISIEGDVRLDKGYSFEYFSTDLRCDDKKIEFVQNHNLLFKKLYEWHFDIFGLIEKGLAVDVNTLNND